MQPTHYPQILQICAGWDRWRTTAAPITLREAQADDLEAIVAVANANSLLELATRRALIDGITATCAWRASRRSTPMRCATRL